MIHILEATNFKKHEHLRVEFEPGLNGIFGPNYAGKTTVLYAILYALGGASCVPGTNLQKMGTNSGMSVTLWFSVGDTQYKIERKKSVAYLYEAPGTVLATGTSPVNEAVEELLGMSMKRFRQLKYAEQKKAHALLSTNANELHKILEELTGIDQINEVLERLRDRITITQGSLEVAQYQDTADLLEACATLQADLAKFTEQGNQLGREWAEFEPGYEAQKKLVENMSEQKKAYDAEEQQQIALRAKVEAFEHRLQENQRELVELGDLPSVSALEHEVDLLKAEADDRHKHMAEHKQHDWQRLQLQQKVTELENNLEYATEKREQLTDIDILTKTEALAEQEHQKADDEFRALDLELAHLKKAKEEGVCSACKRPFEAARIPPDQQISRVESEWSLAKDTLAQAMILLAEAEEATKEWNLLDRDLIALQQQLAEAQKRLEEQKKVVDRLEGSRLFGDMGELHERYDEKKLELDQAVSLSERWHFHKKAIETAEYDLSNAKVALANRPTIAFDPDEFDKQVNKLNRMMDEAKELTQQANYAAEETRRLNHLYDAQKEALSRMEEGNRDHERYKSRLSVATELQKYLRKHRDRFTADIWATFLGSASTFVSNATAGRITEIRRTDSGQFEFVEEERLMSMKDASGAQEAIMGLAVQCALADSAQCPLNVLLVDEATADMDDEHAMALSGLLSASGGQVIAVSHRAMDSSLCDHSIRLEADRLGA